MRIEFFFVSPKNVIQPFYRRWYTGIIGCITLTTLHLNDMWWPSTTLLAVLNKHCFVGLSMAALINFVYALLMGPGFLPFGWQPEVYQFNCLLFSMSIYLENVFCIQVLPSTKSHCPRRYFTIYVFIPYNLQDKVAADGKLQQCWTCEGFKAPRSHHCRKC